MIGPCRHVPYIRNVQSCLLKNPAPLGVRGESHACSHMPMEVFTLRIARSLKLQHSAGGVLRNGRYVATTPACSKASTPGPPQPAVPPWSTRSVTHIIFICCFSQASPPLALVLPGSRAVGTQGRIEQAAHVCQVTSAEWRHGSCFPGCPSVTSAGL